MGREPRGHRPWLWVAVGMVATLAGLVISLASVPAWAQRDDYREAARCQDGPADDCLTEATAVVERKRLRWRRSDRYYVWLRLVRPELARPNAGARIELPDPEPVFDALSEDRAVGVRIWRGRVARVDVPGVGSVETEHSPLTESVELTLFGTGLLNAGIVGLWGGLAMGRAHGWRRTPRAPLGGGAVARGAGRFLVASLAGLVVAGVLVERFDRYEPSTLLVAPAVGGVMWWLVGRRRE